jgi:hypothetical protein
VTVEVDQLSPVISTRDDVGVPNLVEQGLCHDSPDHLSEPAIPVGSRPSLGRDARAARWSRARLGQP